MRNKNWSTALLALLISCSFLLLAGCKPGAKAVYILHLSGTLTEPGVISYAGYEMNVYQDEASNSCGSCVNQPVSVCVGATAGQVAKAIAQAVKKADDSWVVTEQTDTTVVLQEKKVGAKKNLSPPSAPKGLTITGELS